MLRRMNMPQLMEWITYAELEPFGPERDDYRAGAIINVLSNAHRDRKRKPRAFTLEETTPKFGDAVRGSTGPAKKMMNWQAMKALGQAMTAASKTPTNTRRARGASRR